MFLWYPWYKAASKVKMTSSNCCRIGHSCRFRRMETPISLLKAAMRYGVYEHWPKAILTMCLCGTGRTSAAMKQRQWYELYCIHGKCRPLKMSAPMGAHLHNHSLPLYDKYHWHHRKPIYLCNIWYLRCSNLLCIENLIKDQNQIEPHARTHAYTLRNLMYNATMYIDSFGTYKRPWARGKSSTHQHQHK